MSVYGEFVAKLRELNPALAALFDGDLAQASIKLSAYKARIAASTSGVVSSTTTTSSYPIVQIFNYGNPVKPKDSE